MSILAIAKRELADLRRKTAAWEAVVAAYEASEGRPDLAAMPDVSMMMREVSRVEPANVGRMIMTHDADPFPKGRRSERNAKTLFMAKLFIAEKGRVTTTQEIYDYLMSHGIEISGARPRNTLSAMLSNSPEFEAFERKGWKLASAAPKIAEAASALFPNQGALAASFEHRLTSDETPEQSAP